MPSPPDSAIERAPTFSLSLRYFLLGIGSYLLATLGLAFFGRDLVGGSWSPHILALTHLLTIGTILPMVMGATFQLVPVVLMAAVWSEPLGKGIFWLYLTGLLGMVAGFWTMNVSMLAGGATLVVVGLGAFLLNVAASLARGATWSMVGLYLIGALGFLVLAGTVGFLRVLGFWDPAHAVALPDAVATHSHLAAFGFATLLIFGMSYRLVPMFSLTQGRARLERVVLPIAACGALAIACGHLWGADWAARVGASVAALSTWLWASDLWRMYRSRTRRRLDVGLTYAASAVGYLIAASLAGLVLAWGPRGFDPGPWAIAYGLMGLVGWISFSTVGQFHKILPFLAWYHRYGSRVGKEPVPQIHDLFDEKVAWGGFWLSQLGLIGTVAAVLLGQGMGVQLAAIPLALGAGAVVVMVAQSLTR